MEIQTQVIRNLDDLKGLRDSWNAALEDSSNDSAFATYEWFYAWINNFAANLEILIILAWKGEELVGIMPLHISNRSRNRIAREVSSLTNSHTCKFDIVLPNHGSDDVLSAMLVRLHTELPWTVLDLWYVPESTKNIDLLKKISSSLVYSIRTERQMESPYVAIDNTWDNYINGRNKKVRKNWDYFERKLNKDGEMEVTTVTDAVDVDNMLAQAYAIEQSSWKGSQGSAIADAASTAGFYSDLAHGMSQYGKFELHFLSLDKKAVAFDYCLIHKDRYSVLKTGYDPAFSKSSPGRVLRKITLKEIFGRETFNVYDLLGAKDAWKLEWADNCEPLLHVQIFSPRPRARLKYLYAKSKDKGKSILRSHPKLLSFVKVVVKKLKASKD